MKKFKNLLLVLSVGLGLGMISGVAHTGGFTNEVRRVEAATQTATMSYSGSTRNMADTGNATRVGLNATDWKVDASKGSDFPGLNKDKYIALYAQEGCNFTVTSLKSDVVISTITLTYTTSNYNGAKVTVGGVTISDTNSSKTVDEFAINSSSFTVANGRTSGQSRIKSIVITYEEPTKTVQAAFADVKTEAGLSFGYTETLGNAITKVYSVPSYGTVDTDLVGKTYGADGYDFKFETGSASTPFRWYSEVFRSYVGNTLTITMPAGGSVESIDFGKAGVVDVNISEAVAGTGDVTAYTLSDTNSDGKITLTFNKSTFSKIDIKYSAYASSYSDFKNIKMKFRYSFDSSNYENVSEQGFVVTNDSEFDFTTSKTELTSAENTKLVKVAKPETVTTDAFTLGLDIPLLTDAGMEYYNCLEEFFVSAYIVVDGTYYFATPINDGAGYSVDSVITKYLSLKDSEVSPETKDLLRAFQAAIND